nr:hypothetical protein [uncultured bacterium]
MKTERKTIVMKTYYYRVFADYFEFELLDDGTMLPIDSFNAETLPDRVVASPGAIGVATVRNYHVPVVIQILANGKIDQSLALDTWDHIVECSIEITTGRLVVFGATDYYPDAPRIPIAPGCYHVTIFFGGLNTLDKGGLHGEDVYLVMLQPGQATETRVIKRFTASTS